MCGRHAPVARGAASALSKRGPLQDPPGCPPPCPLCPGRLLDRWQPSPRLLHLPGNHSHAWHPCAAGISCPCSTHSSHPSAIIKACSCPHLASLFPFYLQLCLIFKSIILTSKRSSVLSNRFFVPFLGCFLLPLHPLCWNLLQHPPGIWGGASVDGLTEHDAQHPQCQGAAHTRSCLWFEITLSAGPRPS